MNFSTFSIKKTDLDIKTRAVIKSLTKVNKKLSEIPVKGLIFFNLAQFNYIFLL